MDFETQVFKCQASLHKDGKYGMGIVDLIFEDGSAWAILEWGDTHDGSVPLVRVELEFKWLEKLKSGQITHLYQVPIHWPEE